MVGISLNSTKKTQFIDITDKINELIRKQGETEGILLIYMKHTTTGLTVNENETCLIKDMVDFLEKIA